MYLVKDINSGKEHRGIITQIRETDVLITGEDMYIMSDLTGLEDGNFYIKAKKFGRWDERGKFVAPIFNGEIELLERMAEFHEVLSYMQDEDSEVQLQILQNKYKQYVN